MKLTAYNQDTESNRIERLERTRQWAERRMGAPLPILALHDHKGTLYVNWRATPRTDELFAVLLAWQKESECFSNHYVRGRLLIADDDDGGAPPFE